MDRLKRRLASIHPMEPPELLFRSFLKRGLAKLLVILASVFLLLFVSIVFGQEEKNLKEGSIINRPGYNGSQQKVDLKAAVGEEEGEWITVPIEPRKYTRQEFEAVVEKALPELEQGALGENLSLDSITRDLVLPKRLPDSPIEIAWDSDREEVISREGAVMADYADPEGTIVMLTAAFTYEDYKISHSFAVKVKPPLLSEPQRLHRALLAAIERAVEVSENSSAVQLPKEIEGKAVFYEEQEREKGGLVFGGVALGAILWLALLKEELKRREKERERQLLIVYPEFISQLTLLLGAGMTISGAWKRLVRQYEKSLEGGGGRKRYIYEEMMLTWREMQNGVSESDAIERFGGRIRQAPYLKLASLLSQNIRKGSRELTSLLKLEGKMAYEERKETAKQLGEEAGTKLLLPMLMMLGIVLVILLVPAFLSF